MWLLFYDPRVSIVNLCAGTKDAVVRKLAGMSWTYSLRYWKCVKIFTILEQYKVAKCYELAFL